MKWRPLVLAVWALALVGGRAAGDVAQGVFESPVAAKPKCEIDRLAFAKLEALGIQPVGCSDEVFVRRIYLDITGTLPSSGEARAFLKDPDRENKRSRLIDRLLDGPKFTDFWSMKWGDILRIKAEFPVNLWPNAAQAYHRWLYASIASNKRYDQFARELLTSSGSNFRVGSVNFYRAIQEKTPEGIATAVALTLMGARAEKWPPQRFADMTVFFSQVGYKPTREWKEEIIFWDPLGAGAWDAYHAALAQSAKPVAPPGAADAPSKKRTANPSAKPTAKPVSVPDPEPSAADAAKPAAAPTPAAPPVRPTVKLLGETCFPDGKKVRLTRDRDPRKVFADWLIRPENPWFTRSIANRVWSWLFGRGIIHEADDLRPDNPPSNPELLAYLEKELIASGYDLRHLYRLILNSETYQLSSVASFAGYPLRRLEAEVLIDAINQVTGASDLYTSPIPEPFTYIPDNMPATAIADGSITSPFLALFGRSARASGMESERANELRPAHWLHLLNSSHIQRKIEQGPVLKDLFTSGRKPSEIVEELYLTVLSRFPTEDETKRIEAYGEPGKSKRREDWNDIAWALLNSTEFLYRH